MSKLVKYDCISINLPTRVDTVSKYSRPFVIYEVRALKPQKQRKA